MENNNNRSDEIDLGQLLEMIGRGFTAVFHAFLRFFLYLKRNIVILGILAVVGLAVGYGLNQVISKSLKTDIIVKPNGDSADYLYDVVDEIATNLKVRDTSFIRELGLTPEQAEDLKLSIAPIEKDNRTNLEEDAKYLEVLEKFKSDPVISDVVRLEVLGKSTINHKITVAYKDAATGKKAAREIIDFINSNPYYQELISITQDNARQRIKQNSLLIAQIDTLVSAYSQKMRSGVSQADTRITLAEEEDLDLTGLLNLKNGLLRDIERKKLELSSEKEAVRVINFGTTQQVEKPFFGRTIILIPCILIGLFILWDIVKYLDRKAKGIIGG